MRRVPVDDFQRVKAGDLLIEIEDDDYRARVAQAEADLLGAEAAIDNLKARKAAQHAQIAEAENAIKATQADVERTRLEAARQQHAARHHLRHPAKGRAGRCRSRSAFAATLARNQARARGAQRRQMAVLDTQETQLRADVKAKKAALDLAKINLGYTPYRRSGERDGQRARRARRAIRPCRDPGDFGRAARQCLGPRQLQGNPAHPCRDRPARRDPRRHLPGDRGQRDASTASRRRAARSSALLPPDNATGNFTKVVQRIPVKLRIASDNPLAGEVAAGHVGDRDDPAPIPAPKLRERHRPRWAVPERRAALPDMAAALREAAAQASSPCCSAPFCPASTPV